MLAVIIAIYLVLVILAGIVIIAACVAAGRADSRDEDGPGD